MCLTSHFDRKDWNLSDTNCGPLSLINEVGMPNKQKSVSSLETIVFVSRESLSSLTVMYLL